MNRFSLFCFLNSYRDAFSVLKTPETFRLTIDMFCDVISKLNVDAIVGLESRGFILAGAIAYKLGLSIVLIRKKNKLPGTVKSIGYKLHYGSVRKMTACGKCFISLARKINSFCLKDVLEIQAGALKQNDRVVVVDDAVATGGSLLSAFNLIESVGGRVVQSLVIIGLENLGWETCLAEYPITALFRL